MSLCRNKGILVHNKQESQYWCRLVGSHAKRVLDTVDTFVP
jgi:hypothetical protein